MSGVCDLTDCSLCETPQSFSFRCVDCKSNICNKCLYIDSIKCIQCKNHKEDIHREKIIYEANKNKILKLCIYCKKRRHDIKYKSCFNCKNNNAQIDIIEYKKCDKCNKNNHNKKYNLCYLCSKDETITIIKN